MTIQPAAGSKACQLCGSIALKAFVVPRVTQFLVCPDCGLYQCGPLAPHKAYAVDYQACYQQQRRRKLRTAELRLNRIAALLDSDTPRMLDIGCSVGVTVEAATRRGWDAVGVDVSEDAIRLCRQNGHHCTTSDGVELPFADESFDLITAWHVIEHVADIRETLAEWRRVLRVGGLIAIETPNASCIKVRMLREKYRRFWTAHHSYTFSPSNLNAFFREAGLETTARPVFGRLSDLSPAMAGYALLYQAQHGLKRVFGVQKAFQIFARRREERVTRSLAA